MAVGFRAVGSWENGATGLTADEVVAVPAAQVTGDLVIVIGCWKDYAITAQVSGYTELFELADGTTGTGNGLGSMKVGIWYKVAASDTESDPTLDFSTTTGLLGEATIIVFSKGAGETWLTPTYVTRALSWGTGSTTTAASSTIDVPSGGAVLAVAAIRDDSATFTRGNTAIDDSAAAVTWNGNYVEAPATHASTTTGNDMSCDAGYRLVTTGATGVTLRQTGTLSASETGQGAWVVLGTYTPDPKLAEPTAASLSLSGGTPAVAVSDNKTALPTAASLALTGGTPAVATTANVTAQPTAAALALTGATPAVATPVLSQPTTASLALTAGTPAVVATDNKTALPTAAALALTGATPAVVTPVVAQPTAASLVLTGDTPAVLTPVLTEPTAASLVLTGAIPAVAVGASLTAEPTPAALVLTGATPAVLVTNNVVALPTAAALTLAGGTPVVAATENRLALPTPAALVLKGVRPLVVATGATPPSPPRRRGVPELELDVALDDEEVLLTWAA